MSNNLNSKVTLVGLGAMACEYARVLKQLNCEIIAISRSESSAQQFTEKTSIKSYSGGLMKNIALISDTAIVSANVESLAEVSYELIQHGVKSILIEKPGALELADLKKIELVAKEKNVQVFIAYNRRFLSSTSELLKRIQAEGGLQSGSFEFTEWSHVIDKLPESPTKQTTFLSNSTHVLDLAFFLMGKPTEYTTYTNATNTYAWNKGADQFVGAGVTEKNVLFSYHANWTSAGRWGVEVLTKESRYIMRPIEKLFRQPLGSVQIEEVILPALSNGLDTMKPGLFEQTAAFLNQKDSRLVTLQEQIEMFSHYNRINSLKIKK